MDSVLLFVSSVLLVGGVVLGVFILFYFFIFGVFFCSCNDYIK